MEFDSPEVMKDFPGLYSAEKRKGNDSDYNDENEKATKKEMIIGKRKEKKDKKDKDKGYAALEGESSDEASPCKAKKSKAFKFSKSKDKEKENSKDKAECSSKPKKKIKLQKFPKGFGTKLNPVEATQDLAEALPIFGADLKSACQRGKCHDGINIPLPVRQCIDCVEAYGLNFENVYKISGPKNKVQLIKKLYNNRLPVIFTENDVSTATSVLKTFLRDLPEPIFTNDLMARFEEAGAIISYNTRGKHLNSLIRSLPPDNQNLLTWLIIHFHNVIQREQINKMTKNNLAQALNNTLHITTKLFQALIAHRVDLFPNMEIIKYLPPLDATTPYPDSLEAIMNELCKLDSALNLIHWEMQQGFCSEERQDQLWEVQRIQTDLKRKYKKEVLRLRPEAVVSEETEENEDQAMNSPAAEEDAVIAVDDSDDDEMLYTTTTRHLNVDAEEYQANDEAMPIVEAEMQEIAGAVMEAIDGEPLRIPSDIDSDKEEEVTEGGDDTIITSASSEHWELSESGYHQIMPGDKIYRICPSDSRRTQKSVAFQNMFSLTGVSGPGRQQQPTQEVPGTGYGVKIPARNPQQAEYTQKQPEPLNRADNGHIDLPGRQQKPTQEVPGTGYGLKIPARNPQQAEYTQKQPEPLNRADNGHSDSGKLHSETELTSADVAFLRDCIQYTTRLSSLQAKNDILTAMIETLSDSIKQEKHEINEYKKKLEAMYPLKKYKMLKLPRNFEEVRALLVRENHMLEIKKVQLVREIMEQREQCINMEARLKIAEKEILTYL